MTEIPNDNFARLEARQDKTEEKVISLTENVASIASSVKAQGENLESLKSLNIHEHNATREEIRAIATNISSERRGQWPIVLMVVGLLFGVVGGGVGFVTLMVDPLETSISELQNTQNRIRDKEPEQYREQGRQEGKAELQWQLLVDIKDRIHNIEITQAYEQGEQDGIQQKVRDIDTGGSRVWNKVEPIK